MANVNILNLPVATALDGSEYTPIVQGLGNDATTRRVQVGLISGGPAASSQSANTVYSGPAAGIAEVATFRALVAADIPLSTLNINGLAALDDIAVNADYLIAYDAGSGLNKKILPDQIGKPFVILATGQSNFVNNPAYSWEPSDNVFLWNFSGVDGNIGTAFEALDGTEINVTWRFASELAKAKPTQRVYIINISFGGQNISHWMAGATAPDVFQNILDNITPALAAIGVDKIDMFMWWQGESDAGAPTTYVADFETVMSRFEGETWFPLNTPTVVFGITNEANTGVPAYGAFSNYLQTCVNGDPDMRQFVYPASFPQSYWDAGSSYIHMTAEGYDLAGRMAFDEWSHGTGRKTLPNIVVGPESLDVGIGAVNPLYRIDADKDNPTRGIMVRLLNSASAAQTGSQIEMAEAGVGSITIGKPAASNSFVIWNGRTITTDGTQLLNLFGNGYLGIGSGITTPGNPLDVVADDPARGIVARLRNSTSAGVGSQLHFSAAGVGNWVIGQPANTDAFSVWSGRDALTDGTEILHLTSSVLRSGANDQVALGTTTVGFSDLHLATGGVINWANSNVTLTQSAGLLTLAGQLAGTAATGPASNFKVTTDSASVQVSRLEGDRATPTDGDAIYQSFYLSDDGGTQTEFVRFTARALDVTDTTEDGDFTIGLMVGGTLTNKLFLDNASLRPITNDSLSLGDATRGWSDLNLATGALINFANSNYTLTHSSGLLTASGPIAVSATAAAIYSGSGSPESVVAAAAGSIYLNTAGGTDTSLYTKGSGSGNTGWIAVDNV